MNVIFIFFSALILITIFFCVSCVPLYFSVFHVCVCVKYLSVDFYMPFYLCIILLQFPLYYINCVCAIGDLHAYMYKYSETLL